MTRLRPGSRGYLLVLVAVCVSMLTISFLRLAANSAKTDDDAEAEVAASVAYYAAESGLLAAEVRLRTLGSQPPEGLWFAGALEISEARYAVVVLPGGVAKKSFSLRSTGKTDGEGGRVYTSVIVAEVELGPNKAWTVRSRKRT